MDISDIRIFNKFKDLESLSSEDSNDIDKQRACMVRNLDKNEEFRKEVWKRLYGSKFKRNQAVINQAEQEWAEMDQEKKKSGLNLFILK